MVSGYKRRKSMMKRNGYKKRRYNNSNSGNPAGGPIVMKVNTDPPPRIDDQNQFGYYKVQLLASGIGNIVVSFADFPSINASSNVRLCYVKAWGLENRDLLVTLNNAVSQTRTTDFKIQDYAPTTRFPAIGIYIPERDRVTVVSAQQFLSVADNETSASRDFLVEIGVYVARGNQI